MKLQNLFRCMFWVLFLSNYTVFSQESQTPFELPNYFVSQNTGLIKGTFDANKENTFFLFANDTTFAEAEIISETTDAIRFKVPDIPAGAYHLVLEDTDVNSYLDIEVRVLNLSLEVGKTNLHKREKTTLKISVFGTENFEKPISIHVKNNSPRVIVLDQGNDKYYQLQNETNQPVLHLDVPITGRRTGGYSIEVDPNDVMLISWDWEKIQKEALKNLRKELGIKPDASNGEWTNLSAEEKQKKIDEWLKSNGIDRPEDSPDYPTSSTRRPSKGEETGTPPDKKSTCNCSITGNKSHKRGNTIYTISKAMKNKKLAQAFYKKGVTFPVKDRDTFKGQNVTMIPGSAYSTGYGDIVGGFANAVANSFGKPHPKGYPVPYNFGTNYIGTRADIYGTHSVKVKPAKKKWSYVIGVVGVKATAMSSAVDPVEFERKFMKDFDRGREDLEYLKGIYDKIKDPIGVALESIRNSILKNIFGHNTDLSLDDIRKHASNTNTHVSATALVHYLVTVNKKKGTINRKSRAKKYTKIIRKNWKTPKIYNSPTNKEGGSNTGKIIVSDSDSYYVKATLTGNDYLTCYAKGNGYADSGVETKTVVFIIGFCENEDGTLHQDKVIDAGMFVLSDNGKEIAKKETTKIINKLEKYASQLEKYIHTLPTESSKKRIKTEVEDEVRKIIDDWL